MGGVEGAGDALPQLLYQHLTSSCIISAIFRLQCGLSILERGHTLIVMLGE